MKVLLVIALIGCVSGDKPIDGSHHHPDAHHHHDAHHDAHHHAPAEHHESLRIPASTTLLSSNAPANAPANEEIIFLAPEEPLQQEVIRQAQPQQLVPQQVSQESQAIFVQNFDQGSPLVSSGGFVPIDSPPQRDALPPTRVNLPSITQPGIPINQGEPLPLEPLRAGVPNGPSSYVSFDGASNFELDGRHQPQPFREESHHHHQQHHNAHQQPQPVFHHAPQPAHHAPQPVHHSAHQQTYSAPEPAPVYGAPEPAPVYGPPQPAPVYGAPKAPKGQHFQKPRPELPKVKGGLGLLKIPSFEQVVKGSTKIFKDITKDLPDIDDIKDSFKFEMPEFDIKGTFDSAYEDVKYGFDKFKDSIDIFDFAGKGEKGGEEIHYDEYVPNYQYQAPVPAYEKGGYEKGMKGGFEKGQKGGFEKGEKGGHFDFFNKGEKGEKGSKGHFDWFNKGDKASKGTFDLFDKGEKGSKGHFDWFNKGDKASKGHFDFFKAHFNKGNKSNKGHFNKAPKDTYAPPPVAPQPTYGYHAPPQQNYGPPPQTYGAPQPSYHLESSVSEPVRVL